MKNRFYTFLKLSPAFLSLLFFLGCGGGGGGGSGGGGDDTTIIDSDPTVSSGYFVDAPVQGIYYSSATRSGYTDSDGKFSYISGESVTFSIGSVTIGSISSIPSDGNVMPQDIAGVDRDNATNAHALNIARFLQSLDDDGSYQSQITIDSSIHSLLNTPLTISSGTLSSELENIVVNQAGKTFVDESTAQTHLENNTDVIQSSACSTVSINQYLHELMLDQYFWYDQVPSTVDYSSYDSVSSFLDALKYDTLDRFSYVTSTSSQDSSLNTPSSSGMGIKYTTSYDSNGTIVVMYVRPGSPADTAGISRADRITEINGSAATSTLLLSSAAQANVDFNLTLVDSDGNTRYTVITPSSYSYDSVSHTVFTHNGTKIGYMLYDGFTASSSTEIDEAFDDFRDESIDELILDLRYNGGGYVYIAEYLLNKIAGYLDPATMFTLTYNSKQSSKNSTYTFDTDFKSDVSLSRVFFITTGSTASASELVMNALKPYLDVVQVGSTTYGKPVGSSPKTKCDYVFSLINFELENASGTGEYFSGITPECTATDDLDHNFTDADEASMAQILDYISDSDCI